MSLNTKVPEIENKKLTDHNHDIYITTPEFNKLTAEVFDARLARANFVTKADFDDKQKSLNQKNNSNKTKHLLKNLDIYKYKYSGYGIGFDKDGFVSHANGGTGRNAIIIGVGKSSSTKIDNRKKDISILGKGPTQGLEYMLSAEKCI